MRVEQLIVLYGNRLQSRVFEPYDAFFQIAVKPRNETYEEELPYEHKQEIEDTLGQCQKAMLLFELAQFFHYDTAPFGGKFIAGEVFPQPVLVGK